MLRRRAAAAIAVTSLAVLLAAQAAGPAGAQSPPSASAAPLATAVPSAPPDPVLEDAFPDEIAGQPFEVTSGTGAAAFTGSSPEELQQLTDFLARFGRTIDDMSFAMGFALLPSPSDPTDFRGLSIVGFRVRDVAAADLRSELVTLYLDQAGMPYAQATETTIAGRSVVSIADPSSTDPNQAIVVLAAADMVFLVGGTPALVEEAIGKLP